MGTIVRVGAMVILAAALTGCEAGTSLRVAATNAAFQQTAEFLSQTYSIDRIYRSMEGPMEIRSVSLLETDTPELLWITGYRTVIVGPDGETPVSQEFMCHNNLDLDAEQRRRAFPRARITTTRIFTLSQGQFDISLPEGFGVPVLSSEVLTLVTQVLNHNVEEGELLVRHKVFVDFIRDSDLVTPVQPLFPANAFVLALLEGEDGYYGVETPSETQAGATCLPGQHAGDIEEVDLFSDSFGRKFSGHWVVETGREERRTLVTQQMKLPYDTTIHFIALHLHPFAETLELHDLTTGETVFKSHIRGPDAGIGVAGLDHYASSAGIPVYKDHDYELISVYNNTSGTQQDAMATMFFYLHDKRFRHPAQASRRRNR